MALKGFLGSQGPHRSFCAFGALGDIFRVFVKGLGGWLDIALGD